MALESVLQNGAAEAEDLDEAELALFREMRARMEEGARVEFKEDRNGDLIAIESVLHKAEEFRSER